MVFPKLHPGQPRLFYTRFGKRVFVQSNPNSKNNNGRNNADQGEIRNHDTISIGYKRYSMNTVSDNEYTTATIKAELEQLYVAASYLDADSGKLKMAVHLIAAAIAELDNVVVEHPPQRLRLIHNAD